MKNESSDWIFYLNLSKKLDRQFFTLDKSLKKKGISLIPVNIQELLALSRGEDKVKVLCLINNLSRAMYFQKSIRKLMKLMLQNNQAEFFVLSSFDHLNDSFMYSKKDSYFYNALPVDLYSFSQQVANHLDEDYVNPNSWPGTKRRGYISGEKL